MAMRNLSSIRSLLTLTCAILACVSLCAQTVHLNPFAYRIDNIVERNGQELKDDHIEIKYSLSGDATEAYIRLWDITSGANKSQWSRSNGQTVNSGTCIQEFQLTDDYLEKGAHTYNIDFTDLIGKDEELHQKKVRWTIDVKGGNQSDEYTSTTIKTYEVTDLTIKGSTKTDWTSDVVKKTEKTRTFKYVNAQQVTEEEWYINYPGGVDVNTNPYDLNFGVVLCTSSRDVADNTQYFTSGGALHAFGGGMEHLKTKWDDGKKEANGMGGGFSWGIAAEDFSSSKVGLGPHRVRFADDGRVFLTASLNANKILYQVTKPSNVDGNNFYETWTGAKFKQIFPANTWDPGTTTLKSGSTFLAGPNAAFDVRGEGANLRLLLLSHDKNGAVSVKQESFRIDEYAFGDDPTITATPTTQGTSNLLYVTSKSKHNQVTKQVHASADAMVVGYDNSGIEYDPHGGFWIAQLRLSPAAPLAATLVHRTKNGTFEKEEHAVNRGKGAVRHNYDFTRLAVAGGYIQDTVMHKFNSSGSALHDKYYNTKEVSVNGRAFKTHTVKENQITIYTVSYNSSTGAATFTDSMYINTGDLRAVKDIAWDFADNLYVVNRNISDPGKDKKILTAFALPHKDKEVSTPCRTVYHFQLAPLYNVDVKFNPATDDDFYGFVQQTNRTNLHTKNRKPYTTYLHNATIQLTAVEIPNGCKFYQWTNTNSNTATTADNVLTLTNLDRHADITANIGLKVYEDEAPMVIERGTVFPAAFVKRELDGSAYSTICLPFDLQTLDGTPWEGATVLKLTAAQSAGDPIDPIVELNFKEVQFTPEDYLYAGIPYLIKLADSQTTSGTEELIFPNVACPVLKDLEDRNAYNGLSQRFNIGTEYITFHGVMNPTTITDNSDNNLFLVADNRLANITQSTINLKGLRAFFTVTERLKNAKIRVNLPDRAPTPVTTIVSDSLKPTKYLWNGQIYIQRGNHIYDLSGKCVR